MNHRKAPGYADFDELFFWQTKIFPSFPVVIYPFYAKISYIHQFHNNILSQKMLCNCFILLKQSLA